MTDEQKNDRNDEQWFDELYYEGNAERSPAELDALILQSAAQSKRRRWPMLATAAVVVVAAGVLINAPDSVLSPPSQSELSSVTMDSVRQREDLTTAGSGMAAEPASRIEDRGVPAVAASPMQPSVEEFHDFDASAAPMPTQQASMPAAQKASKQFERRDESLAAQSAPPQLDVEPEEPVFSPAMDIEAEAASAPAIESMQEAQAYEVADDRIEEVIVTGSFKRAANAGSALSSRVCPVSIFYTDAARENPLEIKQCTDGRWTLDPERKFCKRYARVEPSELAIDGDTLTWASGDRIHCEEGRFNQPKTADTDPGSK